MFAIAQPDVYRREMDRNLSGDRGDEPGGWHVKPVPAWYHVVLAAKWLGVAPSEFLAMDPYDQGCVRGAMEVERQTQERGRERTRRKRAG